MDKKTAQEIFQSTKELWECEGRFTEEFAYFCTQVDPKPRTDKSAMKTAIMAHCRSKQSISKVLSEFYYDFRGNGVAFTPQYQGLAKLVLAHPDVSELHAGVYREGDEYWDFDLGSSPFIKHKPDLRTTKRKALCSYSVAQMSDGTKSICIIYGNEVEALKKLSKSGATSGDFSGEMEKKGALNRHCKTLPKSDELIAVLKQTHNDFDNEQPEAQQSPIDNTADTLEDLAKQLSASFKPKWEPKLWDSILDNFTDQDKELASEKIEKAEKYHIKTALTKLKAIEKYEDRKKLATGWPEFMLNDEDIASFLMPF